ncbi:hypothetical protein KRR23_11810 [Pseudomonas sp. CVAP|uniref:hypothetical protein n=1 Tax=Pseudomonas sp. CVAP\|nr:hypothetical protein [Pseudomonas sp. CVAP\
MEELIQAKKYARACVAVHAVFEMFCIRVDTAASTQNAGCTMATHAKCTIPKNYALSIPLIYNGFYKFS